MPQAVFERALPAIERPQTHALDCAATGNGKCNTDCADKLFAWVRNESIRHNGLQSSI
jgi:hypothetical protein